MPHETALIVTLASGFGLAFILGMAAQRVKLPPLVGYLVAGIIIGPSTPGFAADAGLAAQLAEIGVVLLMFGVGLHFSFGDLMAVKGIAIPGALARIAIVSAVTAVVSQFWGWGWGAGLLLGVALSVASTVVVLRVLGEAGLIDSTDGRIAVGWLIVEDLAMVLALVLLPAFAGAAAGSTDGVWRDLALTLVKVALFVVLMLVVGTRAVPWLLSRVARTGSRELFTLAVLAVALGIAVGAAALFGVSFALGAFFAGVVIAESDLSHQAAADALPLQDAFAVLFFVSVGMLLDPTVLVREPARVITVVAIVVVAKAIITFGLALLLRRRIRSALLVSASLAQIGEFSFILAGLGISLNLFPEQGRDLILAAALVSITVNPLLMRAVNGLDQWFQQRPRLTDALERADVAAHDLPVRDTMTRLENHVVLVGFGRVGRRIGSALGHEGIPYVVVDRDRVAVESLRKRGIAAVFGDAARPGILDHVHLDSARLLIVASPDTYQARRVTEIARRTNPDLEIAARTHSETAQAYLENHGVNRTFMGERELALSMAHYALMFMGRTDDQADDVIDHMRRATSLSLKAIKR
ncbi:MAG TPA: YbaL family putative K(+) efflux transporter [Gemmatimonadaceae bacterium]|nr:YbaL family putative K(+) efflux transporter [Gemmatimonadaceae bacterium]